MSAAFWSKRVLKIAWSALVVVCQYEAKRAATGDFGHNTKRQQKATLSLCKITKLYEKTQKGREDLEERQRSLSSNTFAAMHNVVVVQNGTKMMISRIEANTTRVFG